MCSVPGLGSVFLESGVTLNPKPLNPKLRVFRFWGLGLGWWAWGSVWSLGLEFHLVPAATATQRLSCSSFFRFGMFL